jgi:dTDP-4-dehydrorhamnose 3,5-epimerase
MNIEALGIEGAWVCTPISHGDDRGSFQEWFRSDLLADQIGRRFEVAQANHSVSTRGVVRGVHFADVPPGQSKVVYCPSGSAVDFIVDVRVGSPTFGCVESVVLDSVDRRIVAISEGLGHAFCALEDGTSMVYLTSTVYRPGAEHGTSPMDPALAIRWPMPIADLRLSGKDLAAPTLDEAAAGGILPTSDACLARYAELAAH